MQRIILVLLFIACASRTFADDTDYQRALRAAHARLEAFNARRYDPRKSKPQLTATEEQERLRLLGQLITDDPVWALAQQVTDDFATLMSGGAKTPADQATAESLKTLLLIATSFQERATTRAEAEVFATILRQFVVRRDVVGATAWAKAQ